MYSHWDVGLPPLDTLHIYHTCETCTAVNIFPITALQNVECTIMVTTTNKLNCVILQELDSLFNDHFGRSDNPHVTAVDTPEVTEQSDEGDTEAEHHSVNDPVTRYIENQDASDDDQDNSKPFYNVDKLPNIKLREGCGCASECFKQFPARDIIDHIWLIRDLDMNDKELQIMTILKDVVDSSQTRRSDRKQTVYQLLQL